MPALEKTWNLYIWFIDVDGCLLHFLFVVVFVRKKCLFVSKCFLFRWNFEELWLKTWLRHTAIAAMPETSMAIEVCAETDLPRRGRRRSDLNEGKGFLGKQDVYNIYKWCIIWWLWFVFEIVSSEGTVLNKCAPSTRILPWKLVIFRTLLVLYWFKPLHWRIQWLFGFNKSNPPASRSFFLALEVTGATGGDSIAVTLTIRESSHVFLFMET